MSPLFWIAIGWLSAFLIALTSVLLSIWRMHRKEARDVRKRTRNR